MAERLVSPGVFTTESDQSFLTQGIGEIGAALLGPTTKGQAFVPVPVTSPSDYRLKFGDSIGDNYTGYTIDEYLTNAGIANVVRVLGLNGYEHDEAGYLVMSGSYGKQVVGVLHRSTTTVAQSPIETLEESTITGLVSGSFYLTISGSITHDKTSYSGSLDSTSADYIGDVLPTEPKTSDVAYAYKLFPNTIESNYTEDVNSDLTLDFVKIDFTSTDYQPASTPWIKSQQIGGNTTNLFKIKTIGDGIYHNTEIKIGITNVRFVSEVPGDYGEFTVVVREVGDTDRSTKVLESYSNVTLDPTSSQYIARIIGDKYAYYSNGKVRRVGDYDSKSNYIYVEVADDVKNSAINKNLIPFGFAAPEQTINTPVDSNLPSCSYVTTQEYNDQYNTRIYYGYNYDFVTTDNKQFLTASAPNTGVGNNVEFSLNNYTINADASDDAGLPIVDAGIVSARKFIVPIQGGFDGMDPATPKNMGADITASNSMGYDFSTSTSSGSVAYQRIFDILSNTDVYDFNLLLTPGVTYDLHPNIISSGIELCETRSDAFYIFDNTKLETSVKTAAQSVLTLDTNYAATYYSWTKILDSNLNRFVWVPASVVVAGAIAYNDRVGYEWYAPAGLNRGGLTSVIDVYTELDKSDRDSLYENRVNPIATFPREGFVIWGQKTLQAKPSALDRVNVRRMLINVKKYIASSSRYLVFENTTRQLYTKFLNIANPYLDQVQQQQGLYEFKVVMDETNNTDDTIDRNELIGSLYLKPTKSAEFIKLDFNVLPTGATFDV